VWKRGTRLPVDRHEAGAVSEQELDLAEPSGGESLLVVDDDPFIARLLEIELKAAGYDVRVASDGVQALEVAQQRCPDLVLADVMMPNMDGFELTRRLRQDPRTAAVSIIMLTARGLSADKLEGFAIGADDYIVKPFDTPELLARIRGVLRRSRDMRAQSPLTGLPGNVRIEEEIEGRLEQQISFAILYADLDHFKAFNDHYGFLRGDEAIQATARMIESTVDEMGLGQGFVGHVGGDDFVVVVPPEVAAEVAQVIVGRFDEMAPDLYDPEDRTRGFIEVVDRRGELQRFPSVSISIGVASSGSREFQHYAEAVAVATEMKQFTKSSTGSSWAMDRRTD
jgi:diguanylate cyclase (GGDEF)-like protein